MKKIIIIGSVVFSGLVFAQHSDNPYVYDEPSQAAEVEKSPGDPGDPPLTPIDDYIPLLMAAAVGMVVVFTKRKKTIDSF